MPLQFALQSEENSCLQRIKSIASEECSTVCKAQKDMKELTANLYSNLIAGRKVNQGYDHSHDVFLQKVPEFYLLMKSMCV